MSGHNQPHDLTLDQQCRIHSSLFMVCTQHDLAAQLPLTSPRTGCTHSLPPTVRPSSNGYCQDKQYSNLFNHVRFHPALRRDVPPCKILINHLHMSFPQSRHSLLSAVSTPPLHLMAPRLHGHRTSHGHSRLGMDASRPRAHLGSAQRPTLVCQIQRIVTCFAKSRSRVVLAQLLVSKWWAVSFMR